MPKLWNEMIEAHRPAVRGAILDTTVALVAKHGLRSQCPKPVTLAAPLRS